MLGFSSYDVQQSLGIKVENWGIVAGLTRFGVMASFVFLFFADRIGRRWVMMATIVGFTLANFATALVRDPVQFVAAQFVARLFLTAEISLAVIMVGEEFPARVRGRAIAILTSLATAGVMLVSKLQPWVLLPAGGESNALHAFGHDLVALGHSALGLEPQPGDWRALYALGVLPLALVLFLRIGMKETRRFAAARAGARRHTWRELAAQAAIPWRREYRRRTAIVTLLWNCVFLVTGPSTVYWVIFARSKLGLTQHQIGDIVFWGYAGGVAGAFAAGWLIERIGRKYTCAASYVLAAVSIFWLYHVTAIPAQYFW